MTDSPPSQRTDAVLRSLATGGYDPNLRQLWFSKDYIQVVELTFRQWKYKTVVTVEFAGSNMTGPDLFNAALSRAYDQLQRNGHGEAVIELRGRKGILTCTHDFEQARDGEEWLGQMLVKAEIVKIGRRA